MSDGITHKSYNADGTFIGSPTNGVREYQHEHMEGPYIATFAFESGEGDVDDAGLRAWFDGRLMTEFATKYEGAEVWRGIVWEMQLEIGGEVRIKSMADMANAVKTRYTNTDGDAIHTGWVTHDESIENYGVKERVVTTSDESLEEAEERAAVELLYHASPYTTAIGYKETKRHRLTVTVVGRMVVANNVQMLTDTLRVIAKLSGALDEDGERIDPLFIYSGLSDDPKRTGAPGDEITVGDEIRRILLVINYSGGWLYPLGKSAIAANDTLTAVGVSSNIGAFDRLLELAKLRNSDGEFYQLRVTNDGGVTYEVFSEEVSYKRHPLPRGLETPGETKPTWDAKPGIVKYVDPYGGPSLPDTWLSDKRLSYYERTVMRDGDIEATFHGRDLDATDIYRAHDANQRWIESLKEPKKKAEKVEKEQEPEPDLYGHT